MNGYVQVMDKITGILTPLWTIISIIAGVVYATYLLASWGLKQEAVDAQIEARVSVLEIGFKDISLKQDKILYIISMKGNKKNEMEG